MQGEWGWGYRCRDLSVQGNNFGSEGEGVESETRPRVDAVCPSSGLPDVSDSCRALDRGQTMGYLRG